MKVQIMQTQLMNDKIIYQVTNTVEEDFDNIDEAVRFIEHYLGEKYFQMHSYGFCPEQKGNILRWNAQGISFIEVADITV